MKYISVQQITCLNVQHGPHRKLANVFYHPPHDRWYYEAKEHVRNPQSGGYKTADETTKEVIRQYEAGNITPTYAAGFSAADFPESEPR